MTGLRPLIRETRRNFSFSFAGPRKLDDIIKTDLMKEKKGSEIAEIWCTFHEDKEDVIGTMLNGADGDTVLKNASAW